MRISQILKDKRMEQQLTQEQLAELIFVSKRTISNWETGKTTPDLENLIQLSEIFNISLDELIKGDKVMVKHMDNKIKKGDLFYINISLVIGLLSLFGVYQLFPNELTGSLLFFGGLLIVYILAVLLVISGLDSLKDWFQSSE